MSIDPTQMKLFYDQLSSDITHEKSQGTPSRQFGDVLSNAARTLVSAEEASEAAVRMMHDARSRMVQGLFADGESESTALLDPLDGLSPYGFLNARQSQIVDKYYRVEAPQPTLLPDSGDKQAGQIDQLITQVAKKYNLSEGLIHSVVATESAYNPQAVSPVGARGLMQLMPATAADLGVTDSFDPQQNLNGGTRYLKQLLDKYDGDLDHALAAYNWGQGNVDRHGLEKMPDETRSYLVKVKSMLAEKQG